MSDHPEQGSGALERIISSTLGAIGGPQLKEIYYAALGDRITKYRITNLANVFREYQEATKGLPPEGKRFVAEKVGIRFLEEASLEDNPDLQKIWANLLAAAVSNKRPEVTPRYISAARELSFDEALFLKAIYDHAPIPRRYPQGISIHLKEASPSNNPDHIDDILEHLIWLNLVRDGVSRRPQQENSSNPKDILYSFGLTKFGWQFLSAVNEGAG
jgi:Abortive infection alpha